MLNVISSVVFLVLFQTNLIFGAKRLLLTDPDVLESRFRQMELELEKHKLKIAALEANTGQTSQGGLYTRWGKSACPGNGTELVYTGVAGGGYFDYYGSAAEYVCLPHDPDFINKVPSNGWVGYMYGGEYEDNLFGTNFQNQNVPCAVCRATHATSILMIPSKISCTSTWKTEYVGKLSSGGSPQKAASQFVCVDNNAEILERGSADENGKDFHAVVAKCGSLPCPPYKEGVALPCVVCSK